MAIIDDYLKQTRDLTIIPPVLLSVLSMQDDNELPFDKLEHMVQTDQILVSRMLRMANSPFYSRGNRVESIRQILTRLGFRTVRSMITLAFMDSIFQNGNYAKFRSEVWEHSIATAIISQFLCEDLQRKKESDIAMLGGLLKDLGKVILNTIDRKKYIEVLTRYLQSEEADIHDIEREIFEVDSIEIGRAVSLQWKLPTQITQVISNTRKPMAEMPVHLQIISFGAMVARKAGFGLFRDKYEDRYNDFMELFGIPPEKQTELPARYRERLLKSELYKLCSSL